MEDLIISPFLDEDYDDAIALWEKTPGMGLSAADERGRISAFLNRNPGLSFAARAADRRSAAGGPKGGEKGRLVGTVLGGTDGRRGYLYHLAVDPEYRRLGLGSGLASRCLGAFKAAGLDKCHLMLINGNVLGESFWKALGWTLREDILLFSKNL
jgi:ribosomal protein S18 acetylase RimI-like enzyme